MRRLTLLFFLCHYALVAADAWPTFAVPENFQSTDLADKIIFCGESDTPPKSTAPECRKISAAENPAAQMKVYRKPYWVFFALKNTSPHDRIFVIEHQLAITARVTLEDLSALQSAPKIAGDTLSMHSRDYWAALPAFRIELKAGENKIYRFMIASNIVTRPGFTLYAEKDFFQARQTANILQAFFYGLMASMIVYNLLLYLRLRLTMYLYYVVFIVSLCCIYLGLFGQGFAFVWVDAFWLQKYGHSIFKFSAAFFGIAFFNKLLNVRLNLPTFDKIIRWMYLPILCAAFLGVVVSPFAYFIIANITITIAILYAIALGIFSLRGKLPFSGYYILAMLSLLVFGVVNMLMTAAILPSNLFTTHAVQIGTALETIFLSIALGDRFAAIERENAQLQIQRLEDKKRIARDIHDVIGSEFQVRMIEIKSEADNVFGQRLAEGLKGTLQKIREFLYLLHTEEQLQANFEANVRKLVERLKKTKKFSIKEEILIADGVLDSSGAYHLERAIEEIVSNIARHAAADAIRFYLRIDQRQGFLAVKDNGVGFDIKNVRKNIGLDSLRYRAERLRGRLKIAAAPGKGTLVALRFKTTV